MPENSQCITVYVPKCRNGFTMTVFQINSDIMFPPFCTSQMWGVMFMDLLSEISGPLLEV